MRASAPADAGPGAAPPGRCLHPPGPRKRSTRRESPPSPAAQARRPLPEGEAPGDADGAFGQALHSRRLVPAHPPLPPRALDAHFTNVSPSRPARAQCTPRRNAHLADLSPSPSGRGVGVRAAAPADAEPAQRHRADVCTRRALQRSTRGETPPSPAAQARRPLPEGEAPDNADGAFGQSRHSRRLEPTRPAPTASGRCAPYEREPLSPRESSMHTSQT